MCSPAIAVRLVIVTSVTWLGGCGAPTDSETDVTFSAVMINSSPRFIVEVQVGDAPAFPAVLDTGSAGLRVVSDMVPASAATLTDQQVHGSFHSGLQVSGVIATAIVSLGALSTPQPIPIQIVDNIDCASDVPGCDLSSIDPKNPFFGQPAILGVGMRTGTFSNMPSLSLGNPIAQLDGSPAFVISAPSFATFSKGMATGTIRINPANLSGFTTYQLQPLVGNALPDAMATPAWHDDAVPMCVTNGTDQTLSLCAGGMLDSGAPGLQLEQPEAPTTAWSTGTAVSVTIGPATQAIGQYAYVISSSPQQGLDATQTDASGVSATVINLGTGVFFRYAVVFDQQNGIIGLSPK